jgi:hypothetical protein
MGNVTFDPSLDERNQLKREKVVMWLQKKGYELSSDDGRFVRFTLSHVTDVRVFFGLIPWRRYDEVAEMVLESKDYNATMDDWVMLVPRSTASTNEHLSLAKELSSAFNVNIRVERRNH